MGSRAVFQTNSRTHHELALFSDTYLIFAQAGLGFFYGKIKNVILLFTIPV